MQQAYKKSYAPQSNFTFPDKFYKIKPYYTRILSENTILYKDIIWKWNMTTKLYYRHIPLDIYIHWPKMKTLHFISLNNCFVSIHVVVRFTHAYQDFVADNDYAIFIQIPGLFKGQRLKNVILTLHGLRNRWFINSFKTDKKTFAAEYW